MNSGAQHKRRSYFIKKKFQIKYTLAIVLTLLVVMFATGIGLYLGMWASIVENFSDFRVSQDLETARRITGYEMVRYHKGDYRLKRIFREAELLSRRQRDALRGALQSVNKSLLPKIALLAILIFIGGIFISHKIAGPMYRFEQSAEAIKEGDLRVHFRVRKSDEMKKTASTLEDMAEALRSDFEKIKTASNDLKEKINRVARNLSEEDVRYLKKITEDLDDILSKYKT